MKIVIAGAGAIGGYIGARLAQAGADVVLHARGAHLQAMQTRGLRVTSADGDFEVRPKTTGDLSSIGKADVVFLGVKAHSLTALAPQLRPLFQRRHDRRQHPERDPVVVLPELRRRVGRASPGTRRSRRRSSPRRSRHAASSGRSRTSRRTSRSPASFITPRGTASASVSRTDRSPIASRGSRRRSFAPGSAARSRRVFVTRSGSSCSATSRSIRSAR